MTIVGFLKLLTTLSFTVTNTEYLETNTAGKIISTPQKCKPEPNS